MHEYADRAAAIEDFVSRIDASTGRVTTRRVGHMPNTAAVAGGRMWVALTQSAADARRGLDPARTVQMVTQGDPWGTTDPPLAFAGPGAQLQRAQASFGAAAGQRGYHHDRHRAQPHHLF